MRASAHDVAAMLIEDQHAAGRTIDKLQLQKLLYLVQGAHLAFWGEPAFREEILAYTYGPVVASIEDTYRDVVSDREPIPRAVGGRRDRLSDEVVDAVREVLRGFGGWTGTNLMTYVKRGDSPWRAARIGLADSAPSKKPLDLAEVQRWFDAHGLDPNPERPETWEPNDEERRVVDDRIRRAKAVGVYVPGLTSEMEEIAERAFARMSGDDSTH